VWGRLGSLGLPFLCFACVSVTFFLHVYSLCVVPADGTWIDSELESVSFCTHSHRIRTPERTTFRVSYPLSNSRTLSPSFHNMEELDLERGRPLSEAIERGSVTEVRHAVQELGLSVDAPVASLRYHAGRVHPLFLALDLFPDPVSPTPLTMTATATAGGLASATSASCSSAAATTTSSSSSSSSSFSSCSSHPARSDASKDAQGSGETSSGGGAKGVGSSEEQDRWAVFAYLLSRRPMLNAPLPSLHGLVGNVLTLLHYACMSASRLPHVRLLLKYVRSGCCFFLFLLRFFLVVY
jgi:hypothetical protein